MVFRKPCVCFGHQVQVYVRYDIPGDTVPEKLRRGVGRRLFDVLAIWVGCTYAGRGIVGGSLLFLVVKTATRRENNISLREQGPVLQRVIALGKVKDPPRRLCRRGGCCEAPKHIFCEEKGI